MSPTLPLALLLLAATPAQAGPRRYTVAVAPDLSALRIQLCFQGPPPEALEAGDSLAPGLIEGALLGPKGQRYEPARRVELKGLGADACLGYTVDLTRLQGRRHSMKIVRSGRSLALAPLLWLWEPEGAAAEAPATVRFALPPGLSVSTPWPRRGPGPSYTLPASARRWLGVVALGRLHKAEIPAAGGLLNVATLDGPLKLTPSALHRWLKTAAEAVALVYGALPVPRVQVLLIPADRGDRPVVFGMSVRGGGPAVMLLLHKEGEDHELKDDWVAIHELFHLGMPWLRDADAWMSEGVTMYYTEVLRARAGLQTPREAWQEIHEGFLRGQKAGTGLSLAEESRLMDETHAYHRVYWGGAWLALQLDLLLRRASGGRRSLDDALRMLHTCCAKMSDPTVWRADAILARIDAWAGSPAPSTLCEATLKTKHFPSTDALYRLLGLRVRAAKIELTEGPASAHRDAIMRR